MKKLLIAATLLAASSAHSATLVVEDGVVMGVNGIHANGTYHNGVFRDVQWDGSGIALVSEGLALSLATKFTKFFNEERDTNLELARLVAHETVIDGCDIRYVCNLNTIYRKWDAYDLGYDLYQGWRVGMNGFDHVAWVGDMSSRANFNPNESFIEWTDTGVVPIPATAFLFAPALLGFLGLRRKLK